MELLIDGDVVAYKIAFISEDKDEQYAKTATDDFLNNMVDYFCEFLYPQTATHDTSDPVSIYLTGKESFRKEIDPTYKENRKDKKKPKHLELIRQHMIDVAGAKIAKNGFEADDCMAYRQTQLGNKNSVIFTVDKDLMMVPGYYYNFDNQTLTYNLPFSCIKHFYSQLLTGDAVDNIKGIEGVGPVGAKKLLSGCVSEEQMFQVVQGQYNDDARMLKNSRLLWMKRHDMKNPVEARLEAVQS